MSEPCQRSSHPLALTVEQQQHPENTPSHPASAPEDRHPRRPSTLSNDNTTKTKLMSSRRRSETSNEATVGPNGCSSHTAQQSATGPNSAWTMSTVNYTRTGRVSKAKKGLKVHDCECGRSYTRAEHLRRHQRNHAQEGAVVCKYPNCGKVFYRSDLLQRHEERHNDAGNASRQPSVPIVEQIVHTSPMSTPASLPMEPTSAFSPAVSYPPQQVLSPQSEAAVFPRYKPTLFRTPQLPRTSKIVSSNPSNHVFQSSPSFKTPFTNVKHQNLAYPIRHSISGPILVDDGTTTSRVWQDPFVQSPYSCSSGYDSPAPCSGYSHIYASPSYGSNVVRTRASSDASFIEQPWTHATQSPTPSISNLSYSWPSEEKNIIVSSFPYTSGSYPTVCMPVHAGFGSVTHYGHFDSQDVVQLDYEEGAELFPEEHYGMGQIAHIYPFEQNLNNFWRLLHPAFPIVHRFTFDSLEPSPLLFAAMIALGAQYSNDVCDRHRARELHKRCIKLLDKRDRSNMMGCNRLCDYQAIFLVELFAQYFAHRCARTLSPRFIAMYEELNGTPSADPSSITDPTLYSSTNKDNIPGQWLEWVKLSTKQRLLLSCYILEFQQSTLLARNRETPVVDISADDLTFPSHKSLWEATDPYEWFAIAQTHSIMPRGIFEVKDNSTMGLYDSFQSLVLIAAYYCPFRNPTRHLSPCIEYLIDGSPITQHVLLTAKLAQMAPIRALLAVSGETWILGTKMTSQPEFPMLRSTLQIWANQLWSTPTDCLQSTEEALRISVAILELSFTAREPFALDMGNEIGIFAAALALWAVTIAAGTRITATTKSLQQSHLPLSLQLGVLEMVQPRPDSYAGTSSIYPDTTSQVPEICQRLPQALLTSSNRRPSVPYSEIKRNTSRFLKTAVEDLGSFNIDACRTGCASLLLWVKMHLRRVSSTEGDCTTVDEGSNSEAPRQLTNIIFGQIDRMLDRGWEGWSI